MISSSQRPLPDSTRHSQQTDIYATGGNPTHDLRRWGPQTYALDRAAIETDCQTIEVQCVNISFFTLSFKKNGRYSTVLLSHNFFFYIFPAKTEAFILSWEEPLHFLLISPRVLCYISHCVTIFLYRDNFKINLSILQDFASSLYIDDNRWLKNFL